MKKPMAVAMMAVCAAAWLGGGGCAGGAAGGGSNSAAAAARADDTRVQGREVVLVVHGMSCPLCANNVNNALREVPGVTNVAVDMGTGRTSVTLAESAVVTRGQLATAVHKSGFSLQSIEAP